MHVKLAVSLAILMCFGIIATLAIYLAQSAKLPDTSAQTAYPLPEPPFTSPSIPYPTPEGINNTPIPLPTQGVITVNLDIDVIVEGLVGNDIAELQIMPDTEKTAAALHSLDFDVPTIRLHNESHKISISAIPVGGYKLIVSAPTSYFRAPQGYLFQVSDAGIIGDLDLPLHFKLIPPSDQ